MKSIFAFTTIYLIATLVSFIAFKPSSIKKYSNQPTANKILPTPNPPTTPPTPTPTLSPTPIPQFIKQDLPFTPQAPSAQWSNPIFQDACEEASIIMANAWIKNQNTLTTNQVEQEITKLAEYQNKLFNTFIDTSAQDTSTLFKNYYNHPNVFVLENPTQQNLINHLAQESLILVPTNGQILSNPHYTAPGPKRHMVVIIGYDLTTQEFITHDPGTRFGKNYRYPFNLLIQSIADYPTGDHKAASTRPKKAIIIKK